MPVVKPLRVGRVSTSSGTVRVVVDPEQAWAGTPTQQQASADHFLRRLLQDTVHLDWIPATRVWFRHAVSPVVVFATHPNEEIIDAIPLGGMTTTPQPGLVSGRFVPLRLLYALAAVVRWELQGRAQKESDDLLEFAGAAATAGFLQGGTGLLRLPVRGMVKTHESDTRKMITASLPSNIVSVRAARGAAWDPPQWWLNLTASALDLSYPKPGGFWSPTVDVSLPGPWGVADIPAAEALPPALSTAPEPVSAIPTPVPGTTVASDGIISQIEVTGLKSESGKVMGHGVVHYTAQPAQHFALTGEEESVKVPGFMYQAGSFAKAMGEAAQAAKNASEWFADLEVVGEDKPVKATDPDPAEKFAEQAQQGMAQIKESDGSLTKPTGKSAFWAHTDGGTLHTAGGKTGKSQGHPASSFYTKYHEAKLQEELAASPWKWDPGPGQILSAYQEKIEGSNPEIALHGKQNGKSQGHPEAPLTKEQVLALAYGASIPSAWASNVGGVLAHAQDAAPSTGTGAFVVHVTGVPSYWNPKTVSNLIASVLSGKGEVLPEEKVAGPLAPVGSFIGVDPALKGWKSLNGYVHTTEDFPTKVQVDVGPHGDFQVTVTGLPPSAKWGPKSLAIAIHGYLSMEHKATEVVADAVLHGIGVDAGKLSVMAPKPAPEGYEALDVAVDFIAEHTPSGPPADKIEAILRALPVVLGESLARVGFIAGVPDPAVVAEVLKVFLPTGDDIVVPDTSWLE